MESLNKINLLPARERVAAELRRAILSGDFKEGRELTLESIAGKLNVSITPVREAFQMIANEGLLELRTNRGAVVKGITREMVQDHFEMRILLESEAVYRACIFGIEIDELLDLHEKTKIAFGKDDFNEFVTLNRAFHFAIWEASKSNKLIVYLTQLWNGPSSTRIIDEKEHISLAIVEHEEMIKYFREKNADQAKQAMAKHIKRSMDNMLSSFGA